MLVELLDFFGRAEDQGGHLVGVRDGEFVGGTPDLHDLAAGSLLGLPEALSGLPGGR